MEMYEEPKIEIILFDTADVIATSDPTETERDDEFEDITDEGGGW